MWHLYFFGVCFVRAFIKNALFSGIYFGLRMHFVRIFVHIRVAFVVWVSFLFISGFCLHQWCIFYVYISGMCIFFVDLVVLWGFGHKFVHLVRCGMGDELDRSVEICLVWFVLIPKRGSGRVRLRAGEAQRLVCRVQLYLGEVVEGRGVLVVRNASTKTRVKRARVKPVQRSQRCLHFQADECSAWERPIWRLVPISIFGSPRGVATGDWGNLFLRNSWYSPLVLRS